jgi:hypothetical protein
MANIVSSNNLTSLYGSGQTTILTSTPAPNVAGTIPSRNLTTLYSGSGNPIQAVLPYGNSNVVSLLNAGTDGANTITNVVATGTVTSNAVSTPTVYSQGMQVQGYDYVQMQYSNGVALPVSPYDIGTGSWFYLDPGGAVWQSNTTGTLHTVTLGNDGNVTANYFIGNVVGNITGVANFANYAGNVTVSNQPNITQVGNLLNLTSNGNVNFANAGNVNLGSNSNVHISGGSSGYVLATDGNSNLSWVSVNTVGIANFANFAGNVTVSNQPNITQVGSLVNLDVTGNTLTNNLTVNLQLSGNTANFVGNIIGANANLGNIVIANYFSGDGSLLTNINGGNVSNVANANYANFAGNAFSVNVANVVGIGNIATTNYDGNAGNVLYGNGGFYALPTIANVANANFANYAGNVTVASQGNITSLGNLINLNVTGSVANNTSFQFVPNGVNVGTTSTNAASFVLTDYGLQPGTSNAQPLTYQFVKSRGNSTTPVASSNNDQTIRFATNYYNGNTYPRNFLFNVLATQAANANFAGSNVAWAPGSFFLNTGHPFGNVTSSTATSSQNSLGFNQFGTLQITPGTYSNGNGTTGTSVLITSYGSNTDGAGQSGQIQMNRARGNRDGLTAVANTDGVGALRFNAYNGNGYQTLAGIFANVNTTTGAIANGSVVPIDISLVVSSNATNVGLTTTFAASGNVTFPSARAVTGGFFYGDGSNLSNINGSNVSNVANANYAAYAGQANNANLATYATTANAVAGANVSGVVANANFAAYSEQANNANLATYATTANSVAVANVSGIGNIATINLDGNSSNILYGNGVFSSVPNTATSNFANYAGNVTVASQGNITSLGNLVNLNITGSTTTSTGFQFAPTGINVGVTSTNAASFVITDYGLQPGTSNGQPLTYQFVKSRGNSATPVASSNNDQTIRFATNYFNGNGYPRNFLFNALATQAANANFTGANVAWGPGSFFINTGNPFGNVTSNTASSSQNSLGLTQFGTLTINPGTYSPGNGQIGQAALITTYGSNTDGAGQSGRIQINRARGNRDGAVAVANTDGVGALTFLAYNGNGYLGTTGIYANVNTTTGAIANGQTVPIDLTVSVIANTGNAFNTVFAASGNVTFPTAKAVTGGFFYGDGSNLTNVTANIANTANNLANVANGVQLNLNSPANLKALLSIAGDGTPNTGMQITNAQASWLIDNVDPTTGFSPFRFQTWQNTSSFTNPMYYFRSRGNISSFPTNQLPVQAGDELVNMVFAGYGDANHTFVQSGTIAYTVTSNDLAGNITVNANISGGSVSSANSNLTLSFGNTYVNSISISNTADVANLKLNKFQENVYNYGNATGTITPDFDNGSIQTLTLTGNITLNTLGNAIAGRSMTLILTQDGTGNRTLTSTMKFAGNYKTLSTSASATDIISVFYTGSTYYASLTTGYA